MSTVVVTSTENQGLVLERPPEKRRPLPRKAAGAQITHSQNEEVVKRNNDVSLSKADNRNGNTVKRLSINNWRASLVPAAAVIPAPIRKTKVAVFKKLVVEFRVFVASWSQMSMLVNRSSFAGRLAMIFTNCRQLPERLL